MHLYQCIEQIVAIGRNYADHVSELNNKVPKEPFFFLKPTSSYVPNNGYIEIPKGVIAHHEGTVSLVVTTYCVRLSAYS